MNDLNVINPLMLYTEIVICILDTFDNNFWIENDFIKYLKESLIDMSPLNICIMLLLRAGFHENCQAVIGRFEYQSVKWFIERYQVLQVTVSLIEVYPLEIFNFDRY